jgi:hypothetical protein
MTNRTFSEEEISKMAKAYVEADLIYGLSMKPLRILLKDKGYLIEQAIKLKLKIEKAKNTQF